MIRRIIIATVAASFVTLVAFGQTKYSRTRAPSPTPTPTPTATAPPRRTTVAPAQPKQWPAPAQKPSPTPTPMPQQKMAPRSGQIQPKQWPTPPQRAMQATPVNRKRRPYPLEIQRRQINATANAGPDSGQTDTDARASSGRQSLSRSPGRELQGPEVPLHREREGPGAYAVPCLGSKEYRRQQHLNVYRHEERRRQDLRH